MKLLYQSTEIIKLFENSINPVGGAAVEWYTWLKAFSNLGNEIGILTFKGAAKNIDQVLNFKIFESYDLNNNSSLINKFISSFYFPYQAIKNYRPDFLLQGCATRFTGYMALFSKLLGIPFIHRIGSDMDVDGRIDKYYSKTYQKIYYWGIKNADHISCQNQYQYNILRKKYPNKSISVLYNPYEFKGTINNSNAKNYIAWIGNFRYEKNLPALAETVKKIPNLKFKIAGTRFNSIDEDTKRGLNELENLNNVEFVGHINNNEIPNFLSQAYCLLNTSRLEGFSNTFLEAWAAGVPVITTNKVNPDNLIKDFNLGIVTEGYESLPDAITTLIKDNNYNSFYERCKKYVKEKHDSNYLAKIFLDEMLKINLNK